MSIRRGFVKLKEGENYIICEDIITTGSAFRNAKQVENAGGNIVAYAALCKQRICSRVGSTVEPKDNCKLPLDKPLFVPR